LGRIDFEKKKKKFLRINPKVGDEQIHLGRIDFEKKKFGENKFHEIWVLRKYKLLFVELRENS
jgi:hypothetical protein